MKSTVASTFSKHCTPKGPDRAGLLDLPQTRVCCPLTARHRYRSHAWTTSTILPAFLLFPTFNWLSILKPRICHVKSEWSAANILQLYAQHRQAIALSSTHHPLADPTPSVSPRESQRQVGVELGQWGWPEEEPASQGLPVGPSGIH